VNKNIIKICKKAFRAICLGIFAWFILTSQAYAYVDPAMTAMITQIVAGILITIGIGFTIFRRKIIMFFRNMNVKRIKRKIERSK